MESFLASLGMVTLAEMGDKTQLLSFMLAARYPRQPRMLIAAIATATAVNHLAAAALGGWLASQISPEVVRWTLGIAFLCFAAWALIPDTLDEAQAARARLGPFATAFIAFFLAEMGDKTQLATVALGAHYAELAAVVIGSTVGMLVANVPAVLLGQRLCQLIPMLWMRRAAAVVFALFGMAMLLGFGAGLTTP